tara:strand:- start:3 stop:365 length:363 start_codon:yes stop_codon:yes gene_type:complete
MNDSEFLVEALLSLKPNCQWTIEGEEVSGLIWLDENSEKPTDEELYDKIAELRAAKPMRLLREERNRKLQETDWWVLPDRTASQEQINYRQSLRDLPSSASPELDENGQLTNVTWPTKPE